MKKLVLMIALCTASALTINAQQSSNNSSGKGRGGYAQQSPEERATKDAEWAEQKLGLNADQKTKWHDASLQKTSANEPLKDKMRATSDVTEKQNLRAQMQANSKKFDDTVNGFLSADQKAKWEQAEKDREASHRGGRGGQGRAGGGPGGMEN